jgi:flagellar motility protein MotE (MotC chaperone)
MIAEAAYFRAERRGFNGGDLVADWLHAEAEIDARLHAGNREEHAESLLARLEGQLQAANEQLRAFRRKLAEASADARDGWVGDVEQLTKLRDQLRRRVKEVRERGHQAAEKARLHADKIWDEISELVERAGSRRKKRSTQ